MRDAVAAEGAVLSRFYLCDAWRTIGRRATGRAGGTGRRFGAGDWGGGAFGFGGAEAGAGAGSGAGAVG